eukprot:3088983-Pyramimonas_sp.AAC.1
MSLGTRSRQYERGRVVHMIPPMDAMDAVIEECTVYFNTAPPSFAPTSCEGERAWGCVQVTASPSMETVVREVSAMTASIQSYLYETVCPLKRGNSNPTPELPV